MNKGRVLLAISYALLVGCNSAVSLADNYAEDENYYDPTLPSPQFARTSLTMPQGYSEVELDNIWTDAPEVVAPENSGSDNIWWNSSSNSGWSNTGLNSYQTPGVNFSFFRTIDQCSAISFGISMMLGGWNQGWGYNDPYSWNNDGVSRLGI